MNMLCVINENTGVAVGLVAALIATAVICTLWLSKRLNAIDGRLSALEEDHYTKAEAAEAALRLAIENPSMNVPDPRNPGQLIRSRGIEA